MRPLLISLIVLLSLATPGVAAADVSQLVPGPTCSKGTVVRRAGVRRVVRRGELYIACNVRTGRHWAMQLRCDLNDDSPSWSGCNRLSRPVLSGGRFAYALRTLYRDYEDGGDYSTVQVVDIDRGRMWSYDACGGGRIDEHTPEHIGATLIHGRGLVKRLIPTPRGALVYSATDRLDPVKGNLICVSQPGHPDAVLAESPAVDTASLSVAGDEVRWTEAGAARSAPIPGASSARAAATRPTTLWAVGDAENSARARVLAALVRREHPDRLLYLGDVYEHGTAQEFRHGYDALYGSLARRTIATPGNHEWGNRAVGYGPYWRAKLGRPLPDWHRHTLPNGWQVVSLNSEGPHGAGSPQARWLAQAVSRPGTCRIAIWHRPRWSSGWHGDQPDMAALWNGLRGHARLVLSGHDHDLQRFADRDGLRQIVSGGGGRPNIPLPRGSRAKLRFVNRTTPGGARLVLTRGRATIEMVASSGRVLDRSVVTCRPVG